MDWSGSSVEARLQLLSVGRRQGAALDNAQSPLSWVPAPPKAYIHRSCGTPSCFAKAVDVRMTAPARLTVLKAFMSNGSKRVSMGTMSFWRLTWKADHPVLLAYGPNELLGHFFAIIPGHRVLLRYLCKVTIQLRRLAVVIANRLLAVCSIAILEQGVHVDRCTDIMQGAKICRSGYLAAHAFDNVVGERRTVLEGTRGGRED